MALSLEFDVSKTLWMIKNNEEGLFMNLCSDLMVEILSRLPAISVINCKLVCKTFLELVSTPKFTDLHVSRSPQSLVVLQRGSLRQLCDLFQFGCVFDYHYLYCNPNISFKLGVLPDELRDTSELISSVNGLVCFYCHGFKNKASLYVCNPITQEYIMLPFIEGSLKHPHSQAHGFGMSMVSGQYKLVRILTQRDSHKSSVDCSVYTLGAGSWRNIENIKILQFAYESGFLSFPIGLFFNGIIHWLHCDLKGSKLICCFDLEKESFQILPMMDNVEGERKGFCTLGVVAGCLCLCDNTSGSRVVLWVMKEYGVKTSWTKGFVIDKMPHPAWSRLTLLHHPLKLYKDGEVVFVLQYYQFLFCYEKRSVETIHNESMLHASSFLSLEVFAGEEVRKVPRQCHKANKSRTKRK